MFYWVGIVGLCQGYAKDARLGAIFGDSCTGVGVEGVHLLGAAEKTLYAG